MTHTLVRDEAGIRALFTELEEGMRLRDPARIVARFAEDAVTFTLAPPLRNTGVDARDPEALAGWMAGFTGPITVEHRDLSVEVSGDVGFVHGLARMAAVPVGYPEGFSMWMRITVGVRRCEGRWLVVHEHQSVPFHMDGSFLAATDLEP
ncbi:YybH family protein [Lentzea flava]|uniref:Ketosteroid isomerase n=1 Tax=Lentzea flava TaxID=103732 RepID=A0ABQ2UBT1_9PSEU|nr:nuclear transport factor 2 family protein [Lentzea flava]MCP2196885.1 Ketosteroid isomerase homolog [Lentzea flava]GGU14776.1 ketosteroid isomerase [Lentzea flava]